MNHRLVLLLAALLSITVFTVWSSTRPHPTSSLVQAPASPPPAEETLAPARAIVASRLDASPESSRVEREFRTYLVKSELHFADGSPVPAADGANVSWLVRFENKTERQHQGHATHEPRPRWIQGELEGRVGERIVVLEARLGNRVVTPRTSAVALPESLELIFIGDLPPDGKVRVVDALTGEDLTRVRVVAGGDLSSQNLSSQPLWLTRAEDFGPSPITLPANARHVPYWIGGAGYAWRRIEFGASSGEPLYALDPGGSLRLDVEPPSDPTMDFVARIERDHGEVLTELTLDGEPLAFDGLPAGLVRIEFLAKHPRYVELSIATREVHIATDSTAELILDLGPLWRTEEFGRIQVSIFLEDERDAGALELAVEAVGATDPRRRTIGASGLRFAPERGLLWGTGPRSVGRHRISASPGSAAVEVDVQAASVAHVILEVPALPKVRLWPMNPETSEPVRPSVIFWRQLGEGDWQVPTPVELDGGLVFPVAYGQIEIAVRAQGFATATLELEVKDSWSEALLDLDPSELREILVRLVSGGHVVPAQGTTWSSTLATDAVGDSVLVQVSPVGSAKNDGESSDGASAIVLVRGSAPCLLTLGDVPGFERSRPRMVFLEGDRTTVDFELTLLGRR